MRKYIFTFLTIISIGLAGCAETDGSSHNPSSAPSVNDVLQAGMAAEDSRNEDMNVKSENSSDDGNEQGNVIVVPLDDSDEGLFDFGDGYQRQTGIDEGAPDPVEMEELYTSTDGIDVDLTVLSSVMVYSQVFDMLTQPEAYIGKTVKMTGIYVCTDQDISDEFYQSCIIQDATACCSQGIEFVLTDDYVFPDDYPEYEDTVTVIGTFDIYKEGGYLYCTLRNARLL